MEGLLHYRFKYLHTRTLVVTYIDITNNITIASYYNNNEICGNFALAVGNIPGCQQINYTPLQLILS